MKMSILNLEIPFSELFPGYTVGNSYNHLKFLEDGIVAEVTVFRNEKAQFYIFIERRSRVLSINLNRNICENYPSMSKIPMQIAFELARHLYILEIELEEKQKRIAKEKENEGYFDILDELFDGDVDSYNAWNERD